MVMADETSALTLVELSVLPSAVRPTAIPAPAASVAEPMNFRRVSFFMIVSSVVKLFRLISGGVISQFVGFLTDSFGPSGDIGGVDDAASAFQPRPGQGRRGRPFLTSSPEDPFPSQPILSTGSGCWRM